MNKDEGYDSDEGEGGGGRSAKVHEEASCEIRRLRVVIIINLSGV